MPDLRLVSPFGTPIDRVERGGKLCSPTLRVSESWMWRRACMKPLGIHSLLKIEVVPTVNSDNLAEATWLRQWQITVNIIVHRSQSDRKIAVKMCLQLRNTDWLARGTVLKLHHAYYQMGTWKASERLRERGRVRE